MARQEPASDASSATRSLEDPGPTQLQNPALENELRPLNGTSSEIHLAGEVSFVQEGDPKQSQQVDIQSTDQHVYQETTGPPTNIEYQRNLNSSLLNQRKRSRDELERNIASKYEGKIKEKDKKIEELNGTVKKLRMENSQLEGRCNRLERDKEQLQGRCDLLEKEKKQLIEACTREEDKEKAGEVEYYKKPPFNF